MQGDYVIERYFVRDGGLACASAIYTYNPDVAKKDANNQNAIDIGKYKKPKKANGKFQRDAEETEQNLADDGEIVIPNVDYFGVLLGVSESKDFSIDPTNYDLQYIRISGTAVGCLIGVLLFLVSHVGELAKLLK